MKNAKRLHSSCKTRMQVVKLFSLIGLNRSSIKLTSVQFVPLYLRTGRTAAAATAADDDDGGDGEEEADEDDDESEDEAPDASSDLTSCN